MIVIMNLWCVGNGVETMSESGAMFDKMLQTLGPAEAVSMLTQSLCSATPAQ